MSGRVTFEPHWPRASGDPPGSALIRLRPEDFEVEEVLGFEADGEGEHCLLHIRKRGLNTADVAAALSRLAGVPHRDVGYCGLKDKHAVTSQWFSVGMAGRPEPNWRDLESENLQLLQLARHRRKLRRGVHRKNRFKLVLRELRGDRAALLAQLEQVKRCGVPNYFGEQRFGRGGNNFDGALDWLAGTGQPPRRQRRSLYLSAARSFLFNQLLAQRVRAGNWEIPGPGDVCVLHGSNSVFCRDDTQPGITERARAADLHLGLPLWGRGAPLAAAHTHAGEIACLAPWSDLCAGLEAQGLRLDYRPARLIADDFYWQFCDDEELQLGFELNRGGYATAVLRELVRYSDNSNKKGNTPLAPQDEPRL